MEAMTAAAVPLGDVLRMETLGTAARARDPSRSYGGALSVF